MKHSGTVFIAADHAGLELKAAVQKLLPDFKWQDLGPQPSDGKVDYPDYAEKVALKVAADSSSLGVLICGSGIGVSMAANKMDGIRAALVENPVSARLSREHNAANILCLGARFLAAEYAAEILQVWLETPAANDPRHLKRIDKITKLESR
jgi:ribose 5-phosphate isomerase B